MRRPWNLANNAIYCLITGDRFEVNMSICSYVTAISRKPKMYAIAVEHGSRSLQLLRESSSVVLQLLRKSHLDLIAPLGKKTGFTFDKASYLRQKEWLADWQKWPVLKGAAANLLLETVNWHTTGDHDLFIMKILKFQSFFDDDVLMFNYLIEQKVIL